MYNFPDAVTDANAQCINKKEITVLPSLKTIFVLPDRINVYHTEISVRL